MENQVSSSDGFKEKGVFWLHVLLVIIAWFGPFVFWWPLMLLGYVIVQLQFYYYNACLLNKAHNLEEEDDTTFYSHLFESWGYSPNKKKLKYFIRQWLYILLAIFTLIWQIGLDNPSLL